MDTVGANPHPPRVLLVEDEVELAEILRQHLAPLGYDVAHAANGADALRMLMDADFDVIVCDMVMPKLPGNMFYLAVQRVKPSLCERFVFITGHGESAGVREFLNIRSQRVIAKPFNLEDLTSAILEIVEGRGEDSQVLA